MLLVFLVVVHLASAHWYNPLADPNATTIFGNARFTVLTPQLIRIEFSKNARFEDHSTLSILNRRLPLVPFTVTSTNSSLQIQTGALNVNYNPSFDSPQGFTAQSISITSPNFAVTWVPYLRDDGNLHGTIRTLEGRDSAGRHELNCSINNVDFDFCTEGLISKNGWTLMDDSDRPLLDGSAWDWVLPRPDNVTDWYFFGYGVNFRQAIKDFTLLSGKIPLPPRANFGIYWSRYWAYSDVGEKEIVREYQNHNTPLDVMVIDMDWHITFYKEAAKGEVDQAGERIGWTGYTWDSGLFPSPDDFLNWVHQKGLKVTLNLHPASGIQPHELRYPQMAKAMGIDPSTKRYVPFQIERKIFAENLFDIMLDPLTHQGVDFWWLDWQQYENTTVQNLNPTFWLNHVFFTRFEQFQGTRPVILHRWGGLGNHRYQLGFSGDVTPTWDALGFQPYFTATAANVGFMWSHDIGGHTQPVTPELYTRWIQFGIWSPVFRTHCTKDPLNDRRIWTYPFYYFQIMRNEIELRSRMVPYIYNSVRTSHENGLTLVYPLYYNWPGDDTYKATEGNQYMFGDSIMVAPVTSPMDTITHISNRMLYVPPGTWIEKDSLKRFQGPAWVYRMYTLDETPVFMKSGSIISMLPKEKPLLGSAADPYWGIHFSVYCNADGTQSSTSLYEDQGNDQSYENSFTTTNASFMEDNRMASFHISPTVGFFTGMPLHRSYWIEFHGVFFPNNVTFDGFPLPYLGSSIEDCAQVDGFVYNVKDLSLTVQLLDKDINSDYDIQVTKDTSLQLGGIKRCFRRLKNSVDILDSHFPTIFQEDYKAVLQANELQSSVETLSNLGNLYALLNQAKQQVKALQLDQGVKARVMTYLNCLN